MLDLLYLHYLLYIRHNERTPRGTLSTLARIKFREKIVTLIISFGIYKNGKLQS